MGRLQIEPGAYLMAAAGLLLLPLQFLTAVSLAVLVHEGSHFLAAKVMGIPVYSLRIRACGCVLDMPPLSGTQELLCAAAGPAGSLLLLGMIRWVPLLALCGAVQGLFNLLPVYPLDGGRILHSCLCLGMGEGTADKVCLWTERVVLLLLLTAGLMGAVYMNWGILPAAAGLLAAGRFGKTKNSLQTGATRGTIELPFSKR